MQKLMIVCLVVLFVSVTAQGDNLVKNGSFEYPMLPGDNTSNYFPSGYSGMEWTVLWAETAGGTSAGSAGNLEFWRRLSPVQPQNGSQNVELDTHGRSGANNANVRIYQSIATCPGVNYALSYYWSPRPFVSAASQSVSVRWADAQLASHSAAGTTSEDWRAGTASVAGSFGLQKLEFVAGGTGDQLGMLLDNVSLLGPDPGSINACTAVNIKPYSDPNSINVCSSGTVPVTIWGSASFNVNTIDPASLMLGGAMVNTVGKTARYQCSISDSGRPESGQFDGIGSPDGYPDMTCHFETAANMFQETATSATVSMTACQDGFTTGCTGKPSTAISAADAVRIVKDGCQ